ncbi:DUF1592 domain-containing protein [Aureliella helgolandensis]|uniref:Planctomycete cytochrome C n=1 Tax=Aureliella helgolandensis TaxID=2527968 RepID=A0A518GFE4_9BACT|nr:DUF1592 domain-containing protein [Aureliella helgolandensis]QDV27322.1 hypothetical protein Q31a_57100 [Aureliella helgolandensis]
MSKYRYLDFRALLNASFILTFSVLNSLPLLAFGVNATLSSFSQSFCVDCHAGADAEAGFDLSQLETTFEDEESTQRWVRVFDRLSRGDMPPADAEQPSAEERRAILAKLAEGIQQAEEQRAEVVLRRLNRVEYENTIHDLFNIQLPLQHLLPQDASTAGFDNVGEGLVLSPETIRAYLKTSELILGNVLGPPEAPPQIKHRTNFLRDRDHRGNVARASKFGSMFRKTPEGIVIFQSDYCPTNLIEFVKLKVPAGTYRGRVRVRAIQSDAPVTLRIYGGDTLTSRREKHVVGYYDIPPNIWTDLEFTDRLMEAGGTYKFQCYNTIDIRKGADTYTGPGLEIGDITIEGPLEEWPPASRQQLLGDLDVEQATLADAEQILKRLLPRALRRPLRDGEQEFYVGLVEQRLEFGDNFEASLRFALQTLLCSSDFLFLNEQPIEDSRGRQRISDYALAARLSYFLWSSTPDVELLRIAHAGKLSHPAILRQQVERLLSAPRGEALVRNFGGQWLGLREIDFTTPDQELFPEFDELLQRSMLAETEHFLQHLLDKDLDVMQVIDSKFTFLNERLAAHYGVPDITGQEMRWVPLPEDSWRGGVLTQASVLKVTANGTNTSPVLRGAWVAEHIMGRPIPPPPPTVSGVEPDIRGARTLREQLAAHRDNSLCASCHDRMDPPGFALESFDPIGGYREHYRTLGDGKRSGLSRSAFTHSWVKYKVGLPVDATGTTPDGMHFEDVREFKRWLLLREADIMRCITGKLMTYATGRAMRFSDRMEIHNVIDRTRSGGNGLRTLVHEVVQSSIFQSP